MLFNFNGVKMKCCVPGCVGNVSSSGYPFPSGAVMRYKWHRAIQIRAPHYGPTSSSTGVKLCKDHFKPEDFETDLNIKEMKVLKIDAIPTVFASGSQTKTGRLLIGDRMRFRQRTQRPAEAIETYIHSLQVHFDLVYFLPNLVRIR